jgi:N-acetylmuramoyl-L-alanine amidase
VIIDGQLQQLRHPVQMHEGQVVIPLKLKDQISGLFVQASSSAPSAKALLPQISIKKVVIDPGHGGKDPGAIGRTGLREKDVNLDIAYRLAKLLRDDGVAVVMTRSTDTFISLERRVDIANNSGADLFISVHSNASRTRSLNGFEAYYVSTKSSDSNRAAAAADKARPNVDGGAFAYTTKPLMATLWDMLLTFNRGESMQLARQICKTIGADLETKILGVKGANFYVLKGARMPAVLLETGFISHAQEERMLKNGYYRQQIAESIERGIIRYAQDYTVMLTYN